MACESAADRRFNAEQQRWREYWDNGGAPAPRNTPTGDPLPPMPQATPAEVQAVYDSYVVDSYAASQPGTPQGTCNPPPDAPATWVCQK